jgi:hypothetical protein
MLVYVLRTKRKNAITNLYIVPLVIVTAFAEQAVMYNTVNIKLVKERVTILFKLVNNLPKFLDGVE